MDNQAIRPDLPKGADLLADGRALARDWTVGPSAFLVHYGVVSELDYKRQAMAEGRIMCHAQIGWRDPAQSIAAYARIYEASAAQGHRVDRYGLCLDWSMALPRATRDKGMRGTGMILRGVEDFVALANAAPVAAHFGDFVLGFPAAVENTQAALAAGATAIGNLGQYFTFRVPGHDDDIQATAATVTALGLIAAQSQPVMVHSNIDDGFAAQFTDLANALGMILVERDIVQGLVGAPIGHAFGHHFSDPIARMAFQRALAEEGASPGSMVYGNTTSYRGSAAQNWASLASYLLVDALGQRLTPSGHAINPVPVTENERIPDVQEVIDAQVFAGRLIEQSAGFPPMIAGEMVEALTARLRAGAARFRAALWAGLADQGVDCADVFAVLLTLRRMGGRRIEAAFGAGTPNPAAAGGRAPVVPATILSEIAEMAHAGLASADQGLIPAVRGLRVLVATTDVHEHGRMVIEAMLHELGAEALDGGTSTDPGPLAALAARVRPDAIALSTYNGVALHYFRALKAALEGQGLQIPVLIGGRLNQIPEGSNTSLPMDVADTLVAEGARVCRQAGDLVAALARASQEQRGNRA